MSEGGVAFSARAERMRRPGCPRGSSPRLMCGVDCRCPGRCLSLGLRRMHVIGISTRDLSIYGKQRDETRPPEIKRRFWTDHRNLQTYIIHIVIRVLVCIEISNAFAGNIPPVAVLTDEKTGRRRPRTGNTRRWGTVTGGTSPAVLFVRFYDVFGNTCASQLPGADRGWPAWRPCRDGASSSGIG